MHSNSNASRAAASLLTAAFAVVAVTACGSSSSKSSQTRPTDQAGPPVYAVRLSEAGCTPNEFTVHPGLVEFRVTNPGETKIEEMEVQTAQGHVVNDVEGVRPGTTAFVRRAARRRQDVPRALPRGRPDMGNNHGQVTELTPRPPAARVVDVVRTYRLGDTEVRALDGATVDFPSGRFTTVLGPSGSGKSTLLHCLAGLEPVTSGEVYLGDIELGRLSRRKRAIVRREHIGIVFQGFNLHPGLDVAHNIALPSMIAGRRNDPDWAHELVTRLFDTRPA